MVHLPEIVSIGIYNSDIAAKGVKVSKNRTTTMFEIELPLEQGGISHIDGERCPITPDTLICVKPGQIRHTHFPFRCYYIHMMVPPGELHDRLCSQPNFLQVDTNKYRQVFTSLCAYYETALEADRLMVYSLILELVYQMDRDSKKNLYFGNAKANHYAVIEKSIQYIKDNLTAQLSLEKLSEMFSFSPTHFHKCFKSATGKTLREYVEHQRLTEAVNLLVSTNMTLAEIAYACGFSSQAYFSYVFKRSTGKTPREYAKEIFRRYD